MWMCAGREDKKKLGTDKKNDYALQTFYATLLLRSRHNEKMFGALLFKVIQMPVSKYYQTKYHYVVAVTDGLDSRICLFVFFSLLSYIVAKPSKKLQSFTLAILQE